MAVATAPLHQLQLNGQVATGRQSGPTQLQLETDQLQLRATNCNSDTILIATDKTIATNLIMLQLNMNQLQLGPTQLQPDTNQLQLGATQLQLHNELSCNQRVGAFSI